MTTPPKRFPLPLAEVMTRRQRKAPTLDKASRVSPAGAPPAAMTRKAGSANPGNGKTPAAGGAATAHSNTRTGPRAASTPMAGASARPGGAQTPHLVVPKGLARPAAAPHAQPAPHAAKTPPRQAAKPAAGGLHKPAVAGAVGTAGTAGASGMSHGGASAKVSSVGTVRTGPSAVTSVPEGMGLTSDRVRARMAERVAASGVKHAGVLAALATVPRHGFVDAALATQAYEDAALPIGHGQTISKPSVVGRMIELLLAGGRPGKRSALPHSRIMIHQPSQSGGGGTASDIEIQAREILYLRAKLNGLYAKHTGRALEQIERDMDRDRYMSAEEAKEYGLVDNVITHRGEIVEPSSLQAVTK